MTNQEKFIKAHQIAKEIKAHCSDYRVAFSLALRQVNTEIKGLFMNELDTLDIEYLRMKLAVGFGSSSSAKSLSIKSVEEYFTIVDIPNSKVINRVYFNFELKGFDDESKYSVYIVNSGKAGRKDKEFVIDGIRFYESSRNLISNKEQDEIRDLVNDTLLKVVARLNEIENEEYLTYKFEVEKEIIRGKNSVFFWNIPIVRKLTKKDYVFFDFNKNSNSRFEVFEPTSFAPSGYFELSKGFSVEFKAKKSDIEIIMSDVSMLNNDNFTSLINNNHLSIKLSDS